MKLNIENLQIRLPAGFEHRASNIAFMISRMLGETLPEGSSELKFLKVDSVRIEAHHTDREAARAITDGILRGMRKTL